MPKLVRPGFPVVGLAACAAQRFPAGAQLRVSASQLQATDRLAACASEIRSGSGAGLGQGTATVPVRMLRGGDGGRENADSLAGVWRRCCSTGRRGGNLIV